MTTRITLRAAALAAALLAATALRPVQAQTAAPDTTAPMTPPPAATPAPVVAPSAPDDTPSHSSNRFRIGPEVGVYLPTDSKTRDRFGSSWFSLGLGFGQINSVKSAGQLGLDLNLQYQKHNGNRIFLLPVGLGYRIGLTKDPEAKTVPYAGVSGDLILADARSVQDNVHSGFKTGVGGSALIGVNFGDSGNIEARYQLTSRIKSFDYSGLSLSAGFRF